MADLNKLTIREAKDGLREKKFSSEELTKDCLSEIKKRDGDLNAFITVTEEEALDSAKDADKKLSSGGELSDLAGIPVAVKDIYNTKGVKTTCSHQF